MPATRVTADVYDIAPMSISDLTSVEYSISAGSHGTIDDAYWDVSIIPVGANFPYPGRVGIEAKWFEIDSQGRRSLHYRVHNTTPSPFKFTSVSFVRRLVRIPAR